MDEEFEKLFEPKKPSPTKKIVAIVVIVSQHVQHFCSVAELDHIHRGAIQQCGESGIQFPLEATGVFDLLVIRHYPILFGTEGFGVFFQELLDGKINCS